MNRLHVGALALGSALLALSACASEPETPVETTDDGLTKFHHVADDCLLPANAVGDDGYTLTLDGRGKDDISFEDGEVVYPEDTVATDQLTCVFESIGTQDSIIARMERTRALDGMQEQSAGMYTYVWTYHPDAGLDVIITMEKS